MWLSWTECEITPKRDNLNRKNVFVNYFNSRYIYKFSRALVVINAQIINTNPLSLPSDGNGNYANAQTDGYDAVRTYSKRSRFIAYIFPLNRIWNNFTVQITHGSYCIKVSNDSTLILEQRRVFRYNICISISCDMTVDPQNILDKLNIYLTPSGVVILS